jgi:acetylornithine deacetylase/succinyl-diaminopimelate desuccinylase-like protein
MKQMPIDELILKTDEVNNFYDRWVPAMRTAQNAPTPEDGDPQEYMGDEREAAEIVHSMLPQNTDVSVREHDISPSGTRPNILVTYTPSNVDSSKKPILFAGVHMDCVPVASEDQLTYHHDDERGYGRGTVDNGSNVLACLTLIKHLAKTKPDFSRPVVFSFTADEEASDTRYGFDGLVEAGEINTDDYAAAIFADVPWSAWSTAGVADWSLEVEIEKGSGHSGMQLSAGTVASSLIGKLNNALSENFPERGPYDKATVMQWNTVTPEKKKGLTVTMGKVLMGGDIRTNPTYPLAEILEVIERTKDEYIKDLKTNPQTEQYADGITVGFNMKAHDDGYLMAEDFMSKAKEIVQAGFEAAGIEGVEPILTIGGGLPGLRGFVDQGLLTIATGAAGNPEDASNYYHTPDEQVVLADVCKGPAYLLGVAKQLDKELLEMGR